jgi:hypothetical protein
MSDNVLGSISIVITGDTSQLNAALNSAVAGAQSAGVKISASMQDSAAGTQQLTIAMGMLAGTIERESAAMSLAIQRNIAMQSSLAGVAGAANRVGSAGIQGGVGLNHIFRGLKDIAEGRGTFALAQLANVLIQIGPAALAAGGALAVVGGMVYAFTELRNKIQDAKDASDQTFSHIVESLRITGDELDVTSAKLDAQIAKLEHKPVNRAAEAMAELKLQSDRAAESLQNTIEKLHEALDKNEIGRLKGLLTLQTATTPIKNLSTNLAREQRGIERSRQSELTDNPEDSQAINDKFEKQISAKLDAYKRLARNEQLKALHTGFDTTELNQQAEDFIDSLTQQQANAGKQKRNIAQELHKEELQDAKKGVEDARALAVAQIEAQEKALDQQEALDKRISDSQIAAQHGVVEAQIAAMVDRKAASIATAEEELRVAKAHQAAITADLAANTAARIALIKAQGAAEGQGRTGTEQRTIGVKTGEKTSAAESKAVEAELTAAAVVAAAQYRLDAERAAVAREKDFETLREIAKQLDANDAAEERAIQVAREIEEIKEKGSGQEAELKATGEKLALERQYGLELAHSKQQELDYLKQIAAIEEKARQEKISDVRSNLLTAQAGANDPETTQGARDSQAKKAAQLQVQLNDLLAASANARYEADTKVLEKQLALNDALQAQATVLQALEKWKDINFGTVEKQFAEVIVSLPQKFGTSLADSLFTKPKQGQSKGAEVVQGLAKTGEGVAKDLAGKLLTDAIEKLIVTLVPQAAIASLQSSVTAANTLAHATNTAAVVGLTTAVAANTAAHAGGSVAGAAGGVSSGIGAASSAASSASMLGPIISGVIGGAISAIATLIGDIQIVHAIHGTTDAVNALGARIGSVTLSSGVSSTPSKATPAPSSAPTALGSLKSYISEITSSQISSALGLFGGAKVGSSAGTPVTIVGINMPSGISGLFGGSGGGGLTDVLKSALGIGGAQGLPVTIVGISDGVQGGGLLDEIFGGGFAKLLGFSGGGNPDPTKPFIAGENGPELIHPRGNALTVVPSGATHALLNGYDTSNLSAPPALPSPPLNNSQAMASPVTNQNTGMVGDLHVHMYDTRNPRENVRQIANYVKLRTRAGSPLNVT